MGDVSDLLDLLPVYYSRLFPFADYHRWLSYGNGKRLKFFLYLTI